MGIKKIRRNIFIWEHLSMYDGYMKRYTTNTKDTCWPDSLACILEVSPKKVPNFVKLYKNAYMEESRKWLAENFRKGIIYIPAKAFMETSGMRNNPPIGPAGFSIVRLSMVDKSAMHVAIAFNGGLLWDNGDSREDEYGEITGYFVIYDLEASGAKWLTKRKKKKTVNKTDTKKERRSK